MSSKYTTTCDVCGKADVIKVWKLEVTPPETHSRAHLPYYFDMCEDCAGHPEDKQKIRNLIKGWLAAAWRGHERP